LEEENWIDFSEEENMINNRKGNTFEDLEEENWIDFSEEENMINNRKGNAFEDFEGENLSDISDEEQIINNRKGNQIEDLEENIVDIAADKNVNTNLAKKGDLAYEVMGLFTKQKVDRYCNSESRNEKIEQDATDVCQLYW
jgi:hypothetical protein